MLGYQRFAGYELVRPLGAPGGFGQVYEATREGERYALKVFHAELLASRDQERFRREVRALEKLSHRNLVDAAGAGVEEVDGRTYHWIAMPYLEGQTLADELRLGGGRLSSARARYVARQMALGLSALHAANIIHRDIKPLNTFVTGDDIVKLLDFGIARFLDYTSLTEHGRMMGTIAYAAPEQLRGDAVLSSDLYSLGVTLYELLTGQLPFGGDLVALVRAIQEDVPEPPSALNPAISSDLDELVLALLAKEPLHRPASADEVAEELRPRIAVAFPSRDPYPRDVEPLVFVRVGSQDVDDAVNACLHGDAPTGLVVGITERPALTPARRAAAAHEAKFAVDPLLLRTAFSNFSATRALRELPYAPEGLSPWQPDDFRTLDASRALAQSVIREQVNCGASMLFSAHFAVRSLDDAWLPRDAKLLEDSLAARDAFNSALPLFALVASAFEPLCSQDALLALANRLRRGRPDGFWLMLDGVEAPGTVVQLVFAARLALLLQELGVPAVIARAGTLRHFFLALGVGGVEVGLGRLDGFRLSDLTQKPRSGGPGRTPPRFEFPSLLMTLPREKALAVLDSGEVPEATCSCQVCADARTLDERLACTSEHNAALLRRERVELVGLDPAERIERLRDSMARARAIARRLRILGVFDGPMDHLRVWEAALGEVVSSRLLEPGHAARRAG